MQELWLFAYCLMLIDIHIKFREDILNGFQVIEWTRFFMTDKVPREISKSINASVMVFALCTSSNVDGWIFYL